MKPVLPAPYHKKTVADIKPEDTSVVIDELEQASKQARPKRRDHGEWDSHSEYMIYARRAIRR